MEEAADMYIQAANAYRIQKQGRKAGQTFEKAAQTQKKTEAKDDAGNTLVEAFKCYKPNDPEDAARVLEEAIELFTLRGQFRRAANYKMDLAQLYESEELHNADKAIAAYDDAGEWFFQDQAEALSNKAFLKMADLAATEGNYDVAVDKYCLVSKRSLNNNLNKWSLKEYFLKAGLCQLANQDTIAANKCLEQFLEWDPSFAQTRECQLLQNLIQAVDDGDEELFTNKLYEFDQFSKLDKWKITITLRIKEKLQAPEDELL